MSEIAGMWVFRSSWGVGKELSQGAAAPQYPGESRADVLRRLVRLGAEAIAEQQHRRRREVTDRAGRYPGLYPPGYLDRLRDEWPE